MRTKPAPLTARQIGLVLAGTLFAGAIAAWLGAISPKTSSAVRQTQGAIDVLTERSPNENWGFFLGTSLACLAGGALVVSRREFFDPSTLREDVLETLQALTSHSNYLLAGGMQTVVKAALTSPPAKKGKEVVLRVLPPAIVSTAEKLSGNRWFMEFMGFAKGADRGQAWQCNFIVGFPGSGKTTLTNEIICGFIKFTDGNGLLRIFDINYGKPDDNGVVNDWMGLPLGQIVEADFHRIFQGLQASWHELEARRKQAIKSASSGSKKPLKFQPMLIVLEELPALFNAAKNADMEDELNRIIADILTMGRGYRIKLLILSQMLAVGSTGLSKAQQQQINKLILGSAGLDPDILNRIPGASGDELKAEIKPLLKQKKRAAIVQFGASLPEIRVVPKLDTTKHRIKVSVTDPDELWWREVWGADVREKVENLAQSYATGEIKSPLKTEIIPLFGISNMSTDERYKKFVKPVWEALVSQYKQEP